MQNDAKYIPLNTITVEDCESSEGTELRLTTQTAGAFAQLFKALSHTVRLQIMDILSRQDGQVCVCEIEAHFSLTQPTISHHLKLLRDAGLITSEQRGLWVYHRVNPDVLTPVRQFLDQLSE
jgi:ArsR family transcriptional regulator